MKISLDWLSEFVTWTERDPRVIAERLTVSTGEVEEIETIGGHLEKCVVGRIRNMQKHPNADRLSLCDVETDQGVKKVVCGGTNLREGMYVAFAHVGARVRWHGTEDVTLERAKIRGEASEGMICAAEELLLIDRFPAKPEHGEHPIIDMGNTSQDVGRPLAEVFGAGDTVLHIDNHAITHRADLFSYIGMARECVALGLARWKKQSPSTWKLGGKLPAFPFSLTVENARLVPRYCAIRLSIDGLGETPEWMRRRLEATGWRSINLPIDITNYVFMETGMPLHSFDIADISGGVKIRSAKKGEKITTLDSVERALPVGTLIMEDKKGIFDLLGVMGGLRGSTKETTKDIWLHSAVVEPVSVRRTIVAMGHRTDAATVYEKGVPHISAMQGLTRAVELFLDLVPGARVSSKLFQWGTDGKGKPVPFSLKDAERKLGETIPPARAKKIFSDLGFSVRGTSVTPPPWRLGDIHGSHDLTEELGRISGYDRIPSVHPRAEVRFPKIEKRINTLRDGLAARRFTEILPLSLLGGELLERAGMDASVALKVENALGEELSMLQPSVLPRLLDEAGKNLLLVPKNLRLFTLSTVFSGGGERRELGMLWARREDAGLKNLPLLRIKDVLREVLAPLGVPPSFDAPSRILKVAHPGRSADIWIGKALLGTVFEVHPSFLQRFDLPKRTAVLLLDVTSLLKREKQERGFTEIPQFPSVTYDATFTLGKRADVGALLRSAKEGSSLLERIEVVDLYDGKPVEPGRFSLTIRCTYRSPKRTLTEEEAKREHDGVLQRITPSLTTA